MADKEQADTERSAQIEELEEKVRKLEELLNSELGIKSEKPYTPQFGTPETHGPTSSTPTTSVEEPPASEEKPYQPQFGMPAQHGEPAAQTAAPVQPEAPPPATGSDSVEERLSELERYSALQGRSGESVPLNFWKTVGAVAVAQALFLIAYVVLAVLVAASIAEGD